MDRNSLKTIGFDGLQGFQDGGEPRFAIPAENGGFVGVDLVAIDNGFDASTWFNGVHVGGEEEGVVAIFGGDDVAVVVTGDVEPEGGQSLGQILGDGLFVSGWAIDSNEVGKGFDESLAIDHAVVLVIKFHA